MLDSFQRAAIRSDARWSQLLAQFNLREAIEGLGRAQRTGVAAEIDCEMRRSQLPTTTNSLVLPWAIFATRADLSATTTAGGYLVETQNLDAADILRPQLLCGPLGMTIVNVPSGSNVSLPKETTAAGAFWLSSETTAITESDTGFGQIAFAPHTIGSYTELSRLLALQSNADAVIRRDLLAVIARAIDQAQINGSGTSGSILGLVNTSGVQTFSAASLTTASITNAEVGLANAINDSTGAATTLTIAGALRARNELGAGSNAIWQGSLNNGRLLGLPARASTAMPASTLIIGSWAFLNLIVWGGLEISVDPFSNGKFQSGIRGIRCMATCDSAPTWASAFSVGSSFS